MNPDFFQDISYLRGGNPKQQRAFYCLEQLELFSQLAVFHPLLAGTLPIQIDIEGSDLDIICEAYQLDEFEERVSQSYNHYPNYRVKRKLFQGLDSVVISFESKEFPIEIFAQAKPSHQQQAWLHMIKEWEILAYYGEAFRKKVIELKKKGVKTEPAFAQLLGLKGDPYQAILSYHLPEEI
ncbi:MAG: DUF4269 domain-containing protein [Bacteroidota bacterium]